MDIAETKVGRRSKPKSLCLRSERRALVGVFDGCGCWGSGPDGGSAVLEAVRDRRAPQLDTLTTEQRAEHLNAAARSLPLDLREEETGCSFSVGLAMADTRTTSGGSGHAVDAGDDAPAAATATELQALSPRTHPATVIVMVSP